MISLEVADPDVEFWSEVDKSGGPDACWPWTGSRNPRGYGMLAGRRAHRVAWRLANEATPLPAIGVLHACDNPPCCNPRHLSAGGQDLNMGDAAAKRRMARGEANARSKLTAEQVKEIRRLLPTHGLREIGRRFGVTHHAIGNIAKSITWRPA